MSRSPRLNRIAHWLRLSPVNRCIPNGLKFTNSRKSRELSMLSTMSSKVNAARSPSFRLARFALLTSASSSFLSQRIFILVTCAGSRFGSLRVLVAPPEAVAYMHLRRFVVKLVAACHTMRCASRHSAGSSRRACVSRGGVDIARYNCCYAFRSHIHGCCRHGRCCPCRACVWH